MPLRAGVSRWLAIVVLGVTVSGCLSDSPAATPDDVKVVSEVASPGGDLVARHYSTSGGGAAGWVYEIVDIRTPPDTAPPDLERAVFVIAEYANLNMRWTGPRALVIEYPQWAGITRGCRTARGVTISYVALTKPDSAWGEVGRRVWEDNQMIDDEQRRKGEPPLSTKYPGLVGTCS